MGGEDSFQSAQCQGVDSIARHATFWRASANSAAIVASVCPKFVSVSRIWLSVPRRVLKRNPREGFGLVSLISNSSGSLPGIFLIAKLSYSILFLRLRRNKSAEVHAHRLAAKILTRCSYLSGVHALLIIVASASLRGIGWLLSAAIHLRHRVISVSNSWAGLPLIESRAY